MYIKVRRVKGLGGAAPGAFARFPFPRFGHGLRLEAATELEARGTTCHLVRHDLPLGALSHSRACLIGLLHKHVEIFSAPPLVQVCLTALCFRSRPQPNSPVAAHYLHDCCSLNNEYPNILCSSFTTTARVFLCRPMAISTILVAADSFAWSRRRGQGIQWRGLGSSLRRADPHGGAST